MNETPPPDATDGTLVYYEEHTEEFARRTRDIDLSELYAEFLPMLPPGGSILDAGCGVGRDSAAFLERGFRVTALDASRAMVEIASRRINGPVLHLSFDQLDFDREFDGIWACASLLHVRKDRMAGIFSLLREAMAPGGVLYASFKRGAGEGFREGRWFNDYDEESLAKFVSSQPGWTIVRMWRTDDVRQRRPDVEWVNVLLRADDA